MGFGKLPVRRLQDREVLELTELCAGSLLMLLMETRLPQLLWSAGRRRARARMLVREQAAISCVFCWMRGCDCRAAGVEIRRRDTCRRLCTNFEMHRSLLRIACCG